MLTSGAGRAAGNPVIAPEIMAIKERGQLIVGMTSFDSPPFYYVPRKERADQSAAGLDGWDVQLATDIARVLDVKLTIDRQAPAFNTVVDQVASNDVDLAISKLSMTARRAVTVQFTQPTIELRHALLANRISLAKKAIDGEVKSVINREFDGSLGVIAKSSYADTARQIFAKAAIHEFAAWDDVVDAVDHGNLDRAYRDELEVKKLMRLRPELHLTLRSVLITDIRDAIAVAVPSRSVQLLAVVNVILAQRRRYDANQLLDQYSDIFQSG